MFLTQMPSTERPDCQNSRLLTDELDLVATSRRLLSFPPALEAAFEDDDRTARIGHYVRSALIALVLYDLFLAFDWQLIPDMFGTACVVRLAIFSPLMLLTLWRIHRTRSVFEREAVSALMASVAFGLVLLLEINSSSPYRLHYHYGVLLIMVFTTVVQRQRFYFAVAGNALMLAMLLAAVLQSNQDHASRVADLFFFPTAAILLCFAAFALEREQRMTFLADMRARRLNAELERMSKIDPLTGLWNRRHLKSLMDEAWSRAGTSEWMAAIVIDVDHFKAFNDRYGHPAGDDCLERVGACLGRAVLPRHGAAVRYGGEEFVLFLPGTGEAEALAIGEAVRQAVRKLAIPNPIDGGPGMVTVSIGVAAGLAATTKPLATIHAADAALYHAKREGRDRIRAASEAEACRFATAA